MSEATIEKPEPKYEKIHFIVGGTRLDRNNKKYYPYMKVEISDGEHDEIHFDKPVVSGRPGQVFEFTKTENGQWGSRGTIAPKYIGLYEDEEYRARLIAGHAAAETQAAYLTKIEKDKTDNALRDLVLPLAAIYKKIPYAQKAAFMMVIEEMISRP